MLKTLSAAGLAAMAAACATGSVSPPAISAAPERDPVRAMHEEMVVFDSHLDTPANFSRPDFDLVADNRTELGRTQVDLPKMERGGLDGGFWVIFTPQGPLDEASYRAARDFALVRASEIREQATRLEALELVTTADAAEAAVLGGKRAVLVSMENAYPLGEDVSLLRAFHALGLRSVSPAHFRNNQFADSATDIDETHGGLSELGRELVREANRLGMVIDGSHAADSAVREMMALSTTPLILSHTGVKAVYDHPRNIDDDLLKAIAEDGGVIQINAYGGYLESLEPSQERKDALAALEAEFGAPPAELPPGLQREFRQRMLVLNLTLPPPRSTFEKFMEHMLHALEIVGPDHVGMGADWDGGGGVEGMEDVSDLPRVTARLLEEGFTREEIEKIWSGNMLRLLRAAEAAAGPGAQAAGTP